jgi:Xaa-Pro aminopeptidase
MSAPTISAAEHRARQAQVAADAGTRGFDGLLVWSTGGSALDGYGDVFWLANHYSQVPRVSIEYPGWMRGWGQTAFVLPAAGRGTLVCESNDWRRDLVVADHVVSSLDLYGQVARSMKEAGLANGRIGLVGGAIIPLRAWEAITSELPGARFEPADEILANRRMRKSSAEVDMMRHANSAAAAIQNAMFEAIAEGKTDNDLARVAYATCCDVGAVPWEFAFASGPHSGHGYWGRLPAWDRERLYERGDIVHPDVYGCVNGYFYDVQRTYIVGNKPGKELVRLLEGAVGVIEALTAACRPGTPVADVARVRGEWLAEHGLAEPADRSAGSDDLLTPLLASGHGVGVGFELPWVYEGSTDLLEPNMTIALEVYISEPGVGTVVNEEVVLVTEGEPEVLTAGSPARHW